MGKPTLMIVLLAYMFLQACIRQQNVKQLLRKPKSRKEIIGSIIADKSLMSELLDSMMLHDKTLVATRFDNSLNTAALDDMQVRMSNMMTSANALQGMIQKMNQQFLISSSYRKLRAQLGKNNTRSGKRLMKTATAKNF